MDKNIKQMQNLIINICIKNTKINISKGVCYLRRKNVNYTKSFSFQWKKWSKVQFNSENVGRPFENYTKHMFENIIGMKESRLNGLIADFGCGSGRFIEVSKTNRTKVVGIDYSSSVEEASKIFSNADGINICYGDISDLPFKNGVFDGGYSIGVIHHTTHPDKTFGEIARTIKPGGWLAVSVYGKDGQYTSPITQAYREIFKILWKVFGPIPALIYSYFFPSLTFVLSKIPIISYLRYPVYLFFPHFMFKDLRWSILDTFDSITPTNQIGISHYELYQWYKANGFEKIKPTDWHGTSMIGTKKI